MRFYLVTIMITFLYSTSCSSQSVEEEKERLFSVVTLPEEIYPIETLEDWYPNGDGYYLSRYELKDDKIYSQVRNQLKSNESFKPLPFGDEIIDDLIFEYVDENDEGYYYLIFNRNDPRDIQMIVLNTTKKELLFLISYQ